jgi:hypothetical protein
MEVGRLTPTTPQGWSTLSGPGVVWNRTEPIDFGEWAALPEDERALIKKWVQTRPIGMLYD